MRNLFGGFSFGLVDLYCFLKALKNFTPGSDFGVWMGHDLFFPENHIIEVLILLLLDKFCDAVIAPARRNKLKLLAMELLNHVWMPLH